MNLRIGWTSIACGIAALCFASSASAWEYRSRFSRWDGTAWVPLASDTLTAPADVAQRIRFEVGVFDDASGAAPAGGFVGWTSGAISANGGSNSRTPGILSPFFYLPIRNGLPAPNPFPCINSIDCSITTQLPIWGCSGMTPLPMPGPIIRGRNAYMQLYEITTTPSVYSYSVTYSGDFLAATEWRPVGSPTPPDCPSGTPGFVTYAPFPTVPVRSTKRCAWWPGRRSAPDSPRWNGTEFVPLCDDTLYVAPGTSTRVRLQIGVFDSNGVTAPAGGLVGWSVGTVTTTGGTNTRTPGRLFPFNLGSTNGTPATDPFTSISSIDATLGTQAPPWNCTPGGTAPPAPSPVIRGRNSYVNMFEVTTQAGAASYSLVFGGNLLTAHSWLPIGTPLPPDCGVPGNPADDVPGSIAFAPFPMPFQAMCRTLKVQIGAPPMDCLGDGVPDACQVAFSERLYSLTGTSSGTPWSWCINSARFPSVCNLTVPGVPAGQPSLVVANAFAASINAASCPDSQLFATASSVLGTTYLVVSVASLVTGDTPFDLCVGASGGPASCCPLMAFSSCSFNPTMTRIPTSGTDCNANGHDDTVDIVLGRSADTNNDGIPDDCQACRADFNGSGMVTSQDFFDFIQAFFTDHPSADFNNNGIINSQDFFEFIAVFFTGC